jgi:hypothetical protein
MDVVQFRREIDRTDSDLRRLLDLLDSIGPAPQEFIVRTSLTSDTVNPWGENDAELERHFGGVYTGK